MIKTAIVHPLVFLVDEDFPYLKDIKAIIQDLQTVYDNEFIYCKSLDISLEELLAVKPGSELKLAYEGKGQHLSYPIIVPFVALKEETSHKKFLNFLKLLHDNFGMFKTNEETDFRFLNIFIRDLNRNIYSDLSDTVFYDSFENYCQESNIPCINFFNIIIDKFAENNLDQLERVSLIFKQLSNFLILLYESKSIDELGLSHSYQALSEEQNSGVRYNTIGMASVGIHDEKVIENISLRRKRSFLDEVLVKNKITTDFYLEINKLSREEIIANYSSFQKDLETQVLQYSFTDDASELLENYDVAQEKCDLHLFASDMELETSELLEKIDEKAIKSKSRLEEVEEEAIRYKRGVLQNYKHHIKEYITKLFNYNKQRNDFEIVISGLESLLKKQQLHVVTQQDSSGYNTITDLKNAVEEKHLEEESVYNSKRDIIRTKLSKDIAAIKNQYKVIKEQEKELALRWLTKNFKNVIIAPVFGLLILGTLVYFGTILIGILSFIFACLIGFLKTFFLKEKIKGLRQDLNVLQQQKKDTIKQYIKIYNEYYQNIQDYISTRETIEAYKDIIVYVRKQQKNIKHFAKTLNEIHENYINQYTDLELNEDIFNRSLLSEADLEYFCGKNELYFFDHHQLSMYYNQFLKDTSGFKPILYPKIKDKLQVDEYISPNEKSYNSKIHFYKEIESVNTDIFIERKQKSGHISYADVVQGEVGDCYFLAALAGIAHKNSKNILNKIKNNEKSVTVQFYDETSQPRVVEIDHKFWVNGNDEPIYAKLTNPIENSYESWVLYVEKAWAKINGLDYTKINGDNISGTIRTIDYSLALTGRKAIREQLTPRTSLFNYHNRIQEHFKNKPIILYSTDEKVEGSHKDIIPQHAFALIEVTDKTYRVYDPHGKEITLDHEELKYNFDLILYFDFEEEKDKHLRGIFSEYFLNPQTITMLQDFEVEIDKNFQEYYYAKSLEELLVCFDVNIDKTKSKDFARILLSASVPYAYTKETHYSDYTVFLFGDNKLINHEIQSLLKSLGVLENRIAIISDVDRRIGILKIHNNLTKKNITI